MTTPITFCPTCRLRGKLAEQAECDTCRRYRTYGVLVDAAVAVRDFDLTIQAVLQPSRWRTGGWLNVLDSVADLMRERCQLERQHRREVAGEALEGQRAARDAYQDGRADARSEEDWR